MLVIRFISIFIYCDQYCTATIYSATCSARGTHIVYVFPNKQSINQSMEVTESKKSCRNYAALERAIQTLNVYASLLSDDIQLADRFDRHR